MFAKPLGILMPTTAIIVVVILVVLVAIVLATRKGKPELPSSEDSSARELPPTDKPSPRADIEPTRPVQRRMTIWSHPAFAMRSVFARNDRELIRVDLSK